MKNKPRITAVKLQHYATALRALIGAIHDARARYTMCKNMRPRQLSGIAKFTKQLLALNHETNYTGFETQLKIRVLRANHRVNGMPGENSVPAYWLSTQLPSVYGPVVERFNAATNELLRSLADVDISKARIPLLSFEKTLDQIAAADRANLEDE